MSLFKKNSASKSRSRKSLFSGRLFSIFPSYTLIVIPNESGSTKKISVPRFAIAGAIVSFFSVTGALAAMIVNYVELRKHTADFDNLRAENHSIRSEAVALGTRLKDIQSTLNRVDLFSDQVRVATRLDPPSGKTLKLDSGKLSNGTKFSKTKKAEGDKSSQKKTDLLKPGIGPLTLEEFELKKMADAENLNSGPNAKFNELEFKSIFETLSHIEYQGGNQAEDLEHLLGEVQAHQSKLASTPNTSPVKGWLTSSFGWRASPINGQSRMHSGLDIAAPQGSPIHATADGVVVGVKSADDYGRYVEVSHGHGIVTRFAHTDTIVVKPGQKVKRGTILATVGMSGRTTGPHVHYEIELNGRRIDPTKFIKGW